MDLGEQYMFRANRDPTSRYYAMAVEEFERGSRVPNASPMPEQGLIVLAAISGQPADPAWWDRVVHKLETRPIGPQEQSMIAGLLRKRREGLAIDDQRFAEAYLVVANRTRMPPYHYYAMGEHALLYAQDRPVAEALFLRAVEYAAGQPEVAAEIADALLGRGERDMAIAVAEHARQLGIADIRIAGAASPPDVQPLHSEAGDAPLSDSTSASTATSR